MMTKVFNFFLTTKALVLPSDRSTKVRIIKVHSQPIEIELKKKRYYFLHCRKFIC